MKKTINAGEGVQICCSQMRVGLSWDIFEGQKEVDLDASCVLFDDFGVILDAAFYNQKTTEDKSVIHSGDCKDGKIDGDDESIIIDFTKLSQKVKAIMIVINAYQGGDFSNVETAEANISDIQLNSPIISMSLGRKGKHTGLIMCIIFKDDFNNWHIKNVDRICGGKNFKEAEFDMKEELYFLIPPEIMAEVKYDPSQQKSFNMKKEQVLNIPTGTYSIGLGWDTQCDLDASCGLFDAEGKYCELIYYGNKTSKDNSVKHMGDNLTGEGSGDDETIHVDLKKVNSAYHRLVFTVTIYTQGYSFKHVKGAYIRLIDQQQKKEMCRYKLTGNYTTSGMIMSSIFRDPKSSQWKFKAIGEGADGKTIYDLKDILVEGRVKKGPVEKRDYTTTLQKLEAEVKQAQKDGKMMIDCYGRNCDKKDFFGLSDPYYILTINGNKVYQSNPIDNTLNPNWQKAVISHQDLNSTWEIQVHDHNSLMSHQLIGTCSFKGIDVKKQQHSKFSLINPKKKYTAKKPNSGDFFIKVGEFPGPVEKLKEVQSLQQNYLRELDEYKKNAYVELYK